MVEFDSLPQPSRSLILATLGLEIASSNCKNVFELARKRHQSVADVWRDVCRKTAQPRCTMPPGVTRPGYVATAPSGEPSTAASVALAANAPARAGDPKSMAAHAAMAVSSQSKTVASATAAHQPRSGRTIALAVGLGAVLVIGVALAVMMPRSSEHTSLTSTARPTEAVRIKSNETAQQPSFVPPPQGTARRMEEINKAFTKR